MNTKLKIKLILLYAIYFIFCWFFLVDKIADFNSNYEGAYGKLISGIIIVAVGILFNYLVKYIKKANDD